jgi:hypothetical protein
MLGSPGKRLDNYEDYYYSDVVRQEHIHFSQQLRFINSSVSIFSASAMADISRWSNWFNCVEEIIG